VYRAELDKLPAEEIEKGWEKQFFIGKEKLDLVLSFYKESGLDLERDVYLRKPRLEELDQKCRECFEQGG